MWNVHSQRKTFVPSGPLVFRPQLLRKTRRPEGTKVFSMRSAKCLFYFTFLRRRVFGQKFFVGPSVPNFGRHGFSTAARTRVQNSAAMMTHIFEFFLRRCSENPFKLLCPRAWPRPTHGKPPNGPANLLRETWTWGAAREESAHRQDYHWSV